MGKPSVAFMLRMMGIIDIMIGGFIEFWLLTIGLYTALYSFEMNKTVSVFAYFFLKLVFGILFIIGGIGLLRRRPYSRIYLNTIWGLLIFFIAFYIFAELRNGFSPDGIGSGFFDLGPWLGGIIFWSVIAILGILRMRFMNSSKVKDYLYNKA